MNRSQKNFLEKRVTQLRLLVRDLGAFGQTDEYYFEKLAEVKKIAHNTSLDLYSQIMQLEIEENFPEGLTKEKVKE